uniref:General secretion pathway protein I n=1 Tax=uncultured Thiotrichaceae bacterium TaxID=298394 RepID=A0A6S6UJ79_9GAMM|nr:MAG: General secretion pathway protein I [uncultured Thiotrichaceae bacterium]
MAASVRFNRHKQPTPHSSQGFSLLEILVAFVMMGLVVGTLLQLFGSSMRNVALSDEYSFAVQIAESRLQTVGTEIEVEQGTERGTEEGTRYNWAVEMEPVELHEDQDDFSLSVQPYRVSVIVAWDSDGRKRQFMLSSLRFGEAE